jgi:mRNA interferase MazF
MRINMFDMYYANLSRNTVNSEQGGIRPVIIIQNDIGNKHSPTVIVLPITSEIKKENMPTHCVIHKTVSNGLKVDSMVMAEQIRVIDKSRLKDKIGHLDNINEQNDVVNAYMANITGRKTYDSWWTKIINMVFKLVKEGAKNGQAA